jgi:hypothetical protein
MTDPFRPVAVRARLITAGALIGLTAFVVGFGYLKFGTVMTHGRVVKAEVLHLGSRPTGGVAGANLPILTVRMPDGSIRQVPATWGVVNDCRPGRSISIIQNGTAVLVGRPGCDTTD